jgi:hypothetical protein
LGRAESESALAADSTVPPADTGAGSTTVTVPGATFVSNDTNPDAHSTSSVSTTVSS